MWTKTSEQGPYCLKQNQTFADPNRRDARIISFQFQYFVGKYEFGANFDTMCHEEWNIGNMFYIRRCMKTQLAYPLQTKAYSTNYL
jgi:hypothetical protein